MNRGSARKWIARLHTETAGFDIAQLAFVTGDGQLWRSPLGVLADFLDQNAWTIGWDGSLARMLAHGLNAKH